MCLSLSYWLLLTGQDLISFFFFLLGATVYKSLCSAQTVVSTIIEAS